MSAVGLSSSKRSVRGLRRVVALLLCAMLAFPPFAFAAPRTTQYVRWDIVEDTTWSGNADYVILEIPVASSSRLPEVKPGVTLTIEAGARVMFANSGPRVTINETDYTISETLIVNGTIDTQGTADNPVVFTGFSDGLNTYAWEGIRVWDAEGGPRASATFLHTIFEHGDTMLQIEEHRPTGGSDTRVSVMNCEFRTPGGVDNYLKGVGIYSDLGDRATSKGLIDIKNTTFRGLGTSIWYHNQVTEREDDIDITIDGCQFTDNATTEDRAPVVIQGGYDIRITNSTFSNYRSDTQPAIYFGYQYQGEPNFPHRANIWGNTFDGGGSGAVAPVIYRAGMRINDDAVPGLDNVYSGYEQQALKTVFASGLETYNHDAYWGPTGLEYYVNGIVAVGYAARTDRLDPPGSLTIPAGTTVHFGPDSGLQVQTEITAVGTEDKPIRFVGEGSGSITLRRYTGDVAFKYCTFESLGHGIFAEVLGEPGSPDSFTVENCIFKNNTYSGMHFSETGSLPEGSGVITNSVFESNGEHGFAGHSTAAALTHSRLLFDECVFRNNSGSGVSLMSAHGIEFRNSLMEGNGGNGVTATDYWTHPGDEGYTDTVANIINCTIAGNYGWGLEYREVYKGTAYGPYVSSTIISGNGAGDFRSLMDGPGALVYSLVTSPSSVNDLGWGTIVADPLFANPSAGDYHLKSASGRWNGAAWVTDSVTSPAINAGDPSLPYAEESAPNGYVVNMGRWGNTSQASRGSGTQPPAQVGGLTASSGGYNTIVLSWTPNAGAEGYEIYRLTTAWRDPQLVASVAGDQGTYTDTGRSAGTRYLYVMRQYRTEGGARVYGSYSKIAGATPVMEAPQNVKATLTSPTEITISWTPVPGASRHRVYYRQVGEQYWGISYPWPYGTDSYWIHTGAASGVEYEYYVEAAPYVSSVYQWGEDSPIVRATAPSLGRTPKPVLTSDTFARGNSNDIPISIVNPLPRADYRLYYDAEGTDEADVHNLGGYESLLTFYSSAGNTRTFWVSAHDALGGRLESELVPVTVLAYDGGASPQILTASFPPAGVGEPYETFPEASGADTINWTVTSGSLPPGLSLQAHWTGMKIAGTPTTAGTYTFTLTADNTKAPAASKELSIQVKPDGKRPTSPASITAAAASDSSVRVSWAAAIDSSGIAKYTVYRSSGAPIDVNAPTTTFVDTSLNEGTYFYAVTAIDSYGNESLIDRFASVKLGGGPANLAPVVGNDTYYVSKDGELTVPAPGVLSNDLDAEGDQLTAHWVSGGWGASITLREDGSFICTPNPGETGVVVFSYRAFDGTDYSEVATVWIYVQDSDPDPDPLPPVIAIQGDDRFLTAVESSKKAFPQGADAVVIATGMNWPDALGGTSLAGALDGPVLLVGAQGADQAVLEEIERLGASKAYIVGGTGVVSTSAEQTLKALLGSSNVVRLSGNDRYETADAVAAEVIEVLGDSFDGTAFVATGQNFPDALAAAPLAAGKSWPLFLADPATGLAASTKAALADVDRVLLLGGVGVVSPATQTYLEGRLGSNNVTRLWGDDRYATAVAVSTWAVENAGHTWNRAGLSTGTNFPDALSGGVLQGKAGSVMLLTGPTALDPGVKAVLESNAAGISTLTFFGGTGAVSDIVRTQARVAAGL